MNQTLEGEEEGGEETSLNHPADRSLKYINSPPPSPACFWGFGLVFFPSPPSHGKQDSVPGGSPGRRRAPGTLWTAPGKMLQHFGTDLHFPPGMCGGGILYFPPFPLKTAPVAPRPPRAPPGGARAGGRGGRRGAPPVGGGGGGVRHGAARGRRSPRRALTPGAM